MRTPPRSVPVVIRLAGPAGRMTTGASPLTTTGNGSSSYFGFKLCACVPLRSQHLPCDALIEFVLRHRMGLRFGLVHGGIEHLPERGRSGGHQAQRRCRSPRWGKRVFLKSECPQREMNRSSDVRQVQWPQWVCAVKRRRFPVGESPTRRNAPAGSNRSSHGGNEMAEAFG
jgi:hypothetical protein